MEEQNTLHAIVDEQGRLILPPGTAAEPELLPGMKIPVETTPAGTTLRRAATQLGKVYVEPTIRCNLTCEICIRNSWNESQGDMKQETFSHLLDGLKILEQKPLIIFGGFGEPLLHRNLVEMIARVKGVAKRVEIITNGLFLTESMVREFVDVGLDAVWFSVDSPHTDANGGRSDLFFRIEMLSSLRSSLKCKVLETGFVYVATSSTIGDFPSLIRSANRYGVSRYMVTNLLPYTDDMCNQTLYTRSLDAVAKQPSPWLPLIQLPRMDWNEHTITPPRQTLRSHHNVQLHNASLDMPGGRCPFIEMGSIVIAWDGSVSPCLALLHSHASYLQGMPRTTSRNVIGTINDAPLAEIWNDADYLFSGGGSRTSTFHPVPPVEAATCWKATRKIVLAISFLHAADVCGPGELFNVLDTRRQDDN